MDEKLIQAIKSSIAHWERMQDLSKIKNQESSVSFCSMKRDIGETPNGENCALCGYFKFNINGISACFRCILRNCLIYKSEYWYCIHAHNHKEFVEKSEIMIAKLKSLLPTEKK